MWFKNLVLYRLAHWNLDAPALERALARLAFRNCSAMEMESRGWVSPRLLSMLAGVAFVVIGAWTLWRTWRA